MWVPSSQTVRWSDIPNDRILEFDPATGRAREYATGVEFTNGRTLDAEGRVVQCSHGLRRVERDDDGVVTGLVDRFEGRRLNSPNDVVVARDGAIWFTDPPYGILPGTVEGHEGEQEYGGCYVFRFDPTTAELTPVITDMVHPNGLAFSPDESLLYVADTAGSAHGVPFRIAVYDVAAHGERDNVAAHDPRDNIAADDAPEDIAADDTLEDNARDSLAADDARASLAADAARDSLAADDARPPMCSGGRTFVAFDDDYPSDGFRVDTEGRIWTSAGASVQVFSPDAGLLASVELPERVANLCFGGRDGQDLYITATTSLYRIRTAARDATSAAGRG